MAVSTFLFYAALAGLCLMIAVAALWLFSRLGNRPGPHANPTDTLHFLIDEGEITECTPLAGQMLDASGPGPNRQWRHLHALLRERFPGIPATAIDALALAPARFSTEDEADPATLTFENVHGVLRVGLTDPTPATLTDRHLSLRHGKSLHHINSAAQLCPYPIWLQSDDGLLEWANRAYYDLRQDDSANDPLAPISELDLALEGASRTRTDRVMIQSSDAGPARWFNVTKSKAEDGGELGFATGIDAVIEAEIAQRKFVQTLTKTFAQLSTGLAIFDRERQLALFNPALIDLLALPADFLSARPTLLTFFDKLRENRMMPEPKDYANWRQQITDLVIASVDGRYQETWTLPSGLTYRVSGRPHPDGAIALLFEDISAEISLTRRFRAQLSLGQAVIDTLDEAISVFSASGVLTLSNATFRRLWKTDPDTSFAEISIRDALRQWESMARPGPFWQRLRDYFSDVRDRTEWFADITMNDGTALECRITPLAGGATLVGFRLRPVLAKGAHPADTVAPEG